MSRRAWVAFAAVSVIWGVPYLFIRIAVRGGVTPLALAWGRLTLAAIVLLTLACRAGTLSHARGLWRWLIVYAIAEVSIPFPLIAFGEQHVASSLAAILIASVPLAVDRREASASVQQLAAGRIVATLSGDQHVTQAARGSGGRSRGHRPAFRRHPRGHQPPVRRTSR